jgi:hypothetical protein
MTPKGTGQQMARAAAERDRPYGAERPVRAAAERDNAGGPAADLGRRKRAREGRAGGDSLTK